MSPTKPPGLTDPQIDDLQYFLDTVENSMNMETIDGFFCALICGPEKVQPDEYLPCVFGGKMPEFADDEARNEILGLLSIHWESIELTLKKNETYYPFFYADMDGKVTANDWVHGFMQGVELRKQAWADLIDKDRPNELLTPVLALHAEYLQRLNPGSEATIESGEREKLVKQIISNLSELYKQYSTAEGGDEPRTLH
jgi:uncharacterized protein